MKPLDASRVPDDLVQLIPLAEEWGIEDDEMRTVQVEDAQTDRLADLVQAFQSVDVTLIDDWLAGPESAAPEPSDEYVAFTTLRMAVDLAIWVLRNRSDT